MGKALGAGALLVLLIACANVAGAMLARSIFRRREIAIRMALGASAQRVGRQLITESLALAVVGGIAGHAARAVAGASAGDVGAAIRFRRGFSCKFDVRTVVFAATRDRRRRRSCSVSSRRCRHGARTSPDRWRRAVAARGASVGLPQRRLLDALVVIEIALALVLLAGSGLLVRAYANLRNTDPGFRPEGVTTFRLSLPSAEVRDLAATSAGSTRRSMERLRAIARSRGASGLVTCLPFGCHWGRFVRAEGAPPRGTNGSNPVVLMRYASSGYFETMGIQLAARPLLRGRRGRARRPASGRDQRAARAPALA